MPALFLLRYVTLLKDQFTPKTGGDNRTARKQVYKGNDTLHGEYDGRV
ncbi:hypothetical protein GGR93_001351 [Sulfitobacter noctilucicola]|uniref:Uncharacterized protein n=1 Tax=Sulfitobacter noctilucicola TaxID=1342301 RepID=A0A7W6Q5B9_9RHOB|nr:hypothetical protein [Sulfitobacter noctilucicola]